MAQQLTCRPSTGLCTRAARYWWLLLVLCVVCALGCLSAPARAFAIENNEYVDANAVEVSADHDAAVIEGAPFCVEDFSRAQKGSNRDIDGAYVGYTYYAGATPDYVCAIATQTSVLVYVPQSATDLVDLESVEDQNLLKQYFLALDAAAINGGIVMSDGVPWYFTDEPSLNLDGVLYQFAEEVTPGKFYVCVIGEDGADVVSEALERDDEAANHTAIPVVGKPTHVDFLRVAAPDAVSFVEQPTGLAALGEFVAGIDLSPLWVTLKTTGTAIIFIFVLGLAAAYFSLRIPTRAQAIADAIFTIPMVLPPTVCGFLLLLCLGRNTALGQWFIDIGFPLIFSWPATVIAAVVVAFPLMYRNARGAFEGLDPNMLDAARTLGWSNAKIFFKLMLPLSWSSIAAGTVLSFARALGEFGATLFLAGNYVGITRTIPIAIYFEWMSGNIDVALFWTLIIIVFSFLVILFINIMGKRTTKYRRRAE